ncbi:MAG: primosomal protein N' [Janthinobacterium lividum]
MTDLPVPSIARVALDLPGSALYDYRCPESLAVAAGSVVRVPFGKAWRVGVVWELAFTSEVPTARLREVEGVCEEIGVLSPAWQALIAFAADYYQRALGEVALPALPQALRDPARWSRLAPPALFSLSPDPEKRAALRASIGARAIAIQRLAAAFEAGPLTVSAARTLHGRAAALLAEWQDAGWLLHEARAPAQPTPLAIDPSAASAIDVAPQLNDQQASAVAAIAERIGQGFKTFLLFGVTGSGKTEVYLRAVEALFARDPTAQVLLLVPEINLAPQLEVQLARRFPQLGPEGLVTLHSGLAEGARARNWLAAHRGQARIVLGTRLAVLASLPALSMIIVDEEHEASYKQQEGLRYSARDLAVWRAKQLDIPVVLGSATPALETWEHAESGRYTRLTLTQRARAAAVLPRLILINPDDEKRRGRAVHEGLTAPLLAALGERLARGEQSLVFLNRRGYAPSLACNACEWVSGCPRCSAFLVLHKTERALRCHHCGWAERIPRACPQCGNVDLAPIGRGTQRVEETLAQRLPAARLLRIDADSTRRRGSAQAMFSEVHGGRVDVLVGTHMIAKGHDFGRVSLVCVVNADAALFSHDFRAGERLFAQLMQVSGRAGRAGLAGEVMIQTRHPHHPIFGALGRHDYAGFAATALDERRDAQLPPFGHQAVLRAEAGKLEDALSFLGAAARCFDELPEAAAVRRYDPVPTTMEKLANRFRAQMLVEGDSRRALQAALNAWRQPLAGLRGARYAVEVDPLEI